MVFEDHSPSHRTAFSHSSSRRLRTGVFGGSFNPLHNGHLSLARQLLEEASLDEIWFVVSPLNPFKQSSADLLPDNVRMEMTRDALEGEPRLVASDYEFHLPKPSYTWNTLSHLRHDFPMRDFVLIIGADNWLSFDRWSHPEEILAHHDILVYPRMGYPIDESTLPPRVHLMHTALYRVSSTDIRERVLRKADISELVPSRIAERVTTLYHR